MENIKYLQKMKQSFIKKGNKSVVENLFFKFLLNKTKKENSNIVLSKARANSTPYVKLRSRRRGKRFLYKIIFIQKEESLKKSLMFFSKNLKENKGSKFLVSLEKELDSLSSGKSSITAKRDEMHRIALENTPYSWRKWKKRKKISNKI